MNIVDGHNQPCPLAHGINLGTVLASLPCVEGALAYGLDTKKIYFSDGKDWFPLTFQEFKPLK